MDGGAWWAAVHGVAKSWTRLHFHFHALEKEMATHSGVLAWRIPGTGKPGGLPSMKRLSSSTQHCYIILFWALQSGDLVRLNIFSLFGKAISTFQFTF